MGILLVYDVTDERSFNSAYSLFLSYPHRSTQLSLNRTRPTAIPCRYLAPHSADIRTWHANIEQHASEGVNKILIGNKSDWTEKRAVTEEQGRELANELGIKFMETSAKANDGVEEAFFTLARSVSILYLPFSPLLRSLLLQVPLHMSDVLPDGSSPSLSTSPLHTSYGPG